MRSSKRLSYLLVIGLALMLCGCTTVSTDERAPGIEAAETAKASVRAFDLWIDSFYLQDCEPPTGMWDDKLETLFFVERVNANRELSCRLRHNALVDLLKERQFNFLDLEE